MPMIMRSKPLRSLEKFISYILDRDYYYSRCFTVVSDYVSSKPWREIYVRNNNIRGSIERGEKCNDVEMSDFLSKRALCRVWALVPCPCMCKGGYMCNLNQRMLWPTQ